MRIFFTSEYFASSLSPFSISIRISSCELPIYVINSGDSKVFKRFTGTIIMTIDIDTTERTINQLLKP
ncbi:hypothetical protein D3C73_953990 [compost metagenome]